MSMMAHRQLYPLQVNPETGEPFLRLPSPLEHIIITPPRETDKPAILELMNDSRVVEWMQGPPSPFLQDHAEEWVARKSGTCDATLRELDEENERNPDGPLKFVEHCPVRSIREVKSDGTEIYVGDCFISRCLFDNLVGESHEIQRQKMIEENNVKVAGDPSIVWSVGDYLAPSHHRRGIMGTALGTLIKSWFIPRMNGHTMETYAFTGNRGSLRVFEKNGFKLVDTIEDWKEVKGVRRGLYVLRWQSDGTAS